MPRLESDWIDLLLAMASVVVVGMHFMSDGAYKYPLVTYFGVTLIVSIVMFRKFRGKYVR
jgi:hypothetical protein